LVAANNPAVSTVLSHYANQLHEIETSLTTLVKSAGQHSRIVKHAASSVGTAFSIVRSASALVYSVELHKRHAAVSRKITQRRSKHSG